MNYSEILPESFLTHHVESFWNLEFSKNIGDQPIELFFPTCTFNMVFIAKPIYMRNAQDSRFRRILPGVYLLGQRTSSAYVKPMGAQITGIRLKPFALAGLFTVPMNQFNNDWVELSMLLTNRQILQLGKSLVDNTLDISEKYRVLNDFVLCLFKGKMKVDEDIRAKLNAIMYQRGCIKVSDLQRYFGLSRMALHKQFVSKVGLTPKYICNIWRMNHVLELMCQYPDQSLTTLAYEAGFYDQAHFSNSFKSAFKVRPKDFYQSDSRSLRLEGIHITKRFNHHYDPR